MLRTDKKRAHRVTVQYVRQTIKSPVDIDTLDTAYEAYIRAKTHWSMLNNDETMIELIGSWARLTRIINEMDDKYGSRQ